MQNAVAKGLFRFNRRRVLAMAAAGVLSPRAAWAADKVNVAISNSTGDFAILIAIKKGYFAEEGLDVNGIVFDSGGKMIAPLGSGEIDVATGSASATLFNAVARGIKIQIASGNGNARPGYGHQVLIVRKQHVDSGRYKSLAEAERPTAPPRCYNLRDVDYIRADGFGISEACRQYILPLIQGEAYPVYHNGLPDYLHTLGLNFSGKVPC